MKNPTRFLSLAALSMLAALLCAAPLSGARAWKVAAGTVTHGTFFKGSGVSFQAPVHYTLYDILRADDTDRVMLRGPMDNARYTPEINITLRRDPLALDNESVDVDLLNIVSELEGKSARCMADERLMISGVDAQRRIFFFYGTDARPNILVRYRWNAGGAGVMADYWAHATTPTVPDDITALPALVESFKVE